eukprot:61721-Pelagomonas_calceolata.AAC.5
MHPAPINRSDGAGLQGGAEQLTHTHTRTKAIPYQALLFPFWHNQDLITVREIHSLGSAIFSLCPPSPPQVKVTNNPHLQCCIVSCLCALGISLQAQLDVVCYLMFVISYALHADQSTKQKFQHACTSISVRVLKV